MGVGEGK